MGRAWARHPVVAFFTHRDRIAFYRQLHSLLTSGTGLTVALAEIRRYTRNGRLRTALDLVAKDLEGGAGLADAMRRHGSLFDDATLELLVFAEESGSLDTVLAKLLSHMEEVQRLRWQAIFYSLWPAYLMVGFVVIGPLFDVSDAVHAQNACAAAAGCGGAGPVAAYVSSFAANLMLSGLAVAVIFGTPFALAALDVEERWDRLKLAVPGLGGVSRSLYGSRFFLALGLGTSAGLEIGRALRLSLKASGSAALFARAPVAEAKIRAGGTLTDAVETLDAFPRPWIGTLAIGERTGQLDAALAQLARDLQEQAVRGMKILLLVAIGLAAIGALGLVLDGILGTLFGPITEYFQLQRQIE